MTTINFEKNEITDGTHTMTPDIRILNDIRLGGDYIMIYPFGTGRIGKRVPVEKVPSLLERVAAEIFPMFAEWEQTKETKLFNELSNIRWSI